MNEAVLTGKQQWMQKATLFVTAASAFSIPFAIRFNSIVLVACFSCLFLFAIISRLSFNDLVRSKLFWTIVAHYVVILFGLLYSSNLSQGSADVERFTFALVIPVFVFIASRFGVRQVHVLYAFTAGCVLLTLYGFGIVLFTLEPGEISNVLKSGHMNFTDHIGIHPTYLGLYFLLIFFFLLEQLRHNRGVKDRAWMATVVVIVYVVAMLVFLRAQIVLLIFFASLILYVLVLFRKRAALITFFLFASGILAFFADPHRVTTFFDRYGKNVSTALDNRIELWASVVETISQQPIIGAGTGDEQDALDAGYRRDGFVEGYENSYNAHNQYLEFIVRNGIIEVVAFLALLYFGFKGGLESTNYTFLLFIMIFCLAMMVESCLNVQKGIVFFYFFLTAFAILPHQKSS
ncbi:MAG: O-antigen ligase family protein [Bacteroidota bacterium]